VKLSGHTTKVERGRDGSRRRGNRDESRNDYGLRVSYVVPPFVRAATSTLKCTTKSDGGETCNCQDYTKTERLQPTKTRMENRRYILSHPHSMGSEYKSFSDMVVCEDSEKGKESYRSGRRTGSSKVNLSTIREKQK
ncbi:hypothetical protein KI387_043062, partial [Taxus chinensis]